MNKRYLHIISEDKPIYVLGDLHGDINSFKREIENRALSECTFIIAGDIGLGFENKQRHIQEYQSLNKFLNLRNIELYLFRGNHDNPEYFNREIGENDEFFLSNVKVLPDYTVLSINNKNILMVGGAISIDRLYRKQRYEQNIRYWLDFYPKLTREDAIKTLLPLYWENEPPFLNTDYIDQITEDGIKITDVVTHTCTSFAFPIDKNGIKYWLRYDDKLKDDLDAERLVFSSLYLYLRDKGHQIERWTYGHFHAHHEEEIEGVLFTTLFNTDAHFDAFEIARKTEEEDIYN